MVTVNWPINSKGDHLTIFNWINWVPYFIFKFFSSTQSFTTFFLHKKKTFFPHFFILLKDFFNKKFCTKHLTSSIFYRAFFFFFKFLMKKVLSWKKFCGEKKVLVEKLTLPNFSQLKNNFFTKHFVHQKQTNNQSTDFFFLLFGHQQISFTNKKSFFCSLKTF